MSIYSVATSSICDAVVILLWSVGSSLISDLINYGYFDFNGTVFGLSQIFHLAVTFFGSLILLLAKIAVSVFIVQRLRVTMYSVVLVIIIGIHLYGMNKYETQYIERSAIALSLAAHICVAIPLYFALKWVYKSFHSGGK